MSGGAASPTASGLDVGGGVFVEGGTVTLINSTISGNRASGEGGSVYSRGQYVEEEGLYDRGVVTLTNSTIAANTSGEKGGGVSISSYGTVRVNKSTISNNTASDGGGVHVAFEDEILYLTNSTISGNRANGDGGGVYNYGNVFLANSTISGNSAGSRGGGLFNKGVGQTRLQRALISGDTSSHGHEVFNLPPTLYFYVGNFNLFGYRGLTNRQAFRGFMPGPTDITATSNGNRPTALAKILNPRLANNGGPTRTHALPSGSPAIDTVTDGTYPPPRLDQRSVKRPQDGNNDGA